MSGFIVAGSDPEQLRQVERVPDAAHRRARPGRRRHRRLSTHLVADQPAQPERAPACCWERCRSCRWGIPSSISARSTCSRRATLSPSSTTTSSCTAGPRARARCTSTNSLANALGMLFNTSVPTQGTPPPTTTGPSSVSQKVQGLIDQANTDFQQAQTDLKAGNFSAYGYRHRRPAERAPAAPASVGGQELLVDGKLLLQLELHNELHLAQRRSPGCGVHRSLNAFDSGGSSLPRPVVI